MKPKDKSAPSVGKLPSAAAPSSEAPSKGGPAKGSLAKGDLAQEDASPPSGGARKGKGGLREAKPKGRKKNNLKRIREEQLLTKAELARRANLSVLTIDRVEKGFGCRMDTKRKILEALGLGPADQGRVFGDKDD